MNNGLFLPLIPPCNNIHVDGKTENIPNYIRYFDLEGKLQSTQMPDYLQENRVLISMLN
jgi:hypothetical protein